MSNWWLRTAGNNSNNAANVKTDGSVNTNGNNVYNTNESVRPASRYKRKLKSMHKAFHKNLIDLKEISQVINSYKGHLEHGNAYKLQSKLLNDFVLSKNV